MSVFSLRVAILRFKDLIQFTPGTFTESITFQVSSSVWHSHNPWNNGRVGAYASIDHQAMQHSTSHFADPCGELLRMTEVQPSFHGVVEGQIDGKAMETHENKWKPMEIYGNPWKPPENLMVPQCSSSFLLFIVSPWRFHLALLKECGRNGPERLR